MTEKLEKKTIIIKSDSSDSSIKSENKNILLNESSSVTTNHDSVTSQDQKETSEDLKSEFEKLNCNDEKFYSSECNKFLLKKELIERNYLSENSDVNSYLYPNLNDKEFNIKIATKKEFNDTKYDGTIHESIKEQADILANADFELQPHQAFVKNFLSFQTPYSSLLLYHGLGTGKCHAKNTPIMMYDGSIKLVQDIVVNDLLMGDDSTPRTVTSLARGQDKMYNIIPVKGEKYTVNEEHILCLKAFGFPKFCHNHYNNTNKKNNFNIQWLENNQLQSRTFTYNKNNEESKKNMEYYANLFFEEIKKNPNTSDNVLEISVKDYLQLSKKNKSFLKGYKVPVNFEEKEVPIDPYKIGYWLGDGSKSDEIICSEDSTIKMKNLNLINNKHIPMIYKCNSREKQIKLLAGLIDSDGYLDKHSGGFVFTHKNEKLIDDVIFLVRSLGFSCYKNSKKDICTYKGVKKYGIGYKGITYKIIINGEGIEEIPTLIHRKSTNTRKDIKDVKDDLVTGIKVEYVNEDEYFGFTLDGNCRYLMGDFTVTHNTCSAIGVCEEMRDYMKQMGITKRIIIVASENVQDNFKLQLFDERKLKLVDGIWNIRSCTGNKLLQEINPMNMKGMPKEKVISQIKNIINTYYIFLGYVQFANYIIKTMNYNEEVKKQGYNKKIGETTNKKNNEKTKIQILKDVKIELNSRIIKRLRNEFDNRLIVIDEVHNIRKTDDNENKKVAINLELLVKSALNMRFLFLSATPMYNNYKEIVWLLNMMNINDRRGKVEVKDIFDKNGNLKKNGDELLIRKATGYISFVRGENPYTFPYRVYPNEFAKDHTFPKIHYPIYQMNLKKIKHEDKKRILSLYLNKIGNCNNCGNCQYCAYKYIIYNLRNKQFNITTKTGVVKEMPSFENMESFGYTLLQTPLESLIISYPFPGLKNILDEIPNENFSEELSPSFSETTITAEEVEDESPGPVEEVIEEEIDDTENIEIETNKDNKSNKGTKNKKIITDNKGTKNKKIITENDDKILGGTKTSPLNTRTFTFVDPRQLTGRLGLERMMNFDDVKSPPVKGNFEYKKNTIDTYGKIFSKELIGNYSSKIKAIIDNIVNPETSKVSEGVILIYSQYIDSGLIPMALALEELGFTRYGEDVKPLFKNKPCEVVDVRTMKEPENKKDFMPARYSMITGETRISPNNVFEVKGLTDEDNKDGNKVKVVLISKAGSEGIDFKFIRQVHILEPWYNMNRIEQIIGRAVRNFSHKDLPVHQF
jgi:hypothetical protein